MGGTLFGQDEGASAGRLVEVQFVVEPSCAGWRLDRYLCHKLKRLSRARVQRIIARDILSPKGLKPSTIVRAGLTFTLQKRVHDEPEAPMEVRELYRDEDVLAVDKPAGLPMHPTARYHENTLLSALARRYGEAVRADPAHRLDRETSGGVVCALSQAARVRLPAAFAAGEVRKQYLALVEGHPPRDDFTVDAPLREPLYNVPKHVMDQTLGEGEVVRLAVRVDASAGKSAVTRFAVERRFLRDGAPYALVRAFPLTGRQHQIRAHLRHAGFSIVGDKIYGPDEGYFDRFSRGCLEPEAWQRLKLARQALHAAVVELAHPVTRAPLRLEAPLPSDLQAFLPS